MFCFTLIQLSLKILVEIYFCYNIFSLNCFFVYYNKCMICFVGWAKRLGPWETWKIRTRKLPAWSMETSWQFYRKSHPTTTTDTIYNNIQTINIFETWFSHRFKVSNSKFRYIAQLCTSNLQWENSQTTTSINTTATCCTKTCCNLYKAIRWAWRLAQISQVKVSCSKWSSSWSQIPIYCNVR